MSKVIAYTLAYNAETTLPRTIESVLAQTHDDIAYYIVDNGSHDSTGSIIKTFADRDSRIIPRTNAVNYVFEPGNMYFDLLDASDPNHYFCMLDADDEYKPDFLEKSLTFMQNNSLDVVACGSDFISSTSGELLSVRALPQDLILEGDSFGTEFPNYHEFMRTYWGKLYAVRIIQNWISEIPHDLSYGADTLLAQGAFRRSRRVAILAGSLHKYYLNTQSSSYHFDDKRVRGDRLLFDAAKDFLMSKVGFISPHNEHFLYSVYLNAIKDTLGVLVRAQISDSEKMEHVRYLKVEMDEIQSYFSTLPPRPPNP